MLVQEGLSGKFNLLTGQTFDLPNGSVISTRSLRLWPDDDLAAVNLYRPAPIEPPPEGYQHTGPTRYERIDGVVRTVRDVELIPPKPPPRHELPTLRFLERFTPAERFLIGKTADQMASADPPDFSLYDQWSRVVSSQTIWLEDPEVADGIPGLETVGLLAEGRAAEILSTDGVPPTW